MQSTNPVEPTPPPAAAIRAPLRLARIAIAGVLMGVANLIPGVSGGTMVLAMGLYQEFIDSVADLTRLRLSLRRIMFIGVIGACAGGAIFGLAGLILYLLFHYPTAMFALFIGLTLGGAPLLLRQIRPLRTDAVVGVVLGFALMVSLFLLKTGDGMPHGTAMDLVSGVVGSTTMVLPGISGSYVLLVLDQYERVVGAVHDCKEAAVGRDMDALKAALMIIVPVGIGAVVGIVILSNVLKFLLHRHARPTVGVLLGILLGSVLGLWPFGKQPGEKALERRTPVELRAFADAWAIPDIPPVDPHRDLDDDHATLVEAIGLNWEKRGVPSYTPGKIGIALGCAAAGFVTTYALARRKQESSTS